VIIDTHCHLNFPDAFPDPAKTISEAVVAGVERMMAVGCDTITSQYAIDLAQEHDAVYAIVGWHPNYASKFSDAELANIRAMLDRPKVVALGEIGLDYHWDYATRDEQHRCLHAQLELAQELDVPVVFHCREAYADLLNVLGSFPSGSKLFHCFSGNADNAERIVNMDGYFGIDGPITYKKSQELREIIKTLPRDRIVLETDSPYLTPEPHRGKPNRPANTTLVNAMLASMWGVEAEESAAVTTANSQRFFRI
jgi:TatD DNase family protein